jgi:AcrR family transcriptional regulator
VTVATKGAGGARAGHGLALPPTDDPHRDRLLEGLAASIREKGLARTQISDVVRHAKASRRTFYQSFADKEACFVELAHALTSASLDEVRSAVDDRAPWDAQVDQAIGAYLGILAADPAMTVTFSSELPMLGARGVSIQRSGIERFAELFVLLVHTDTMRAAGVPDVSLDTAVMLVGGLHEMIVRAVDRGEPVERLAPTATAVVKAVLDPAR